MQQQQRAPSQAASRAAQPVLRGRPSCRALPASDHHSPTPPPAAVFELAARRPAPAAPAASRAVAVAPAPALPAAAAASAFALPSGAAAAAGVALALAAAGAGAKAVLDRPSRPYAPGSVGREYDAWTQEGILEYYWGEHIHLGFYTDQERAKGAWSKDFKQAKLDFVDRMLAFAALPSATPGRVLDVGCGIGGTTRHLARTFGPSTQLTGITLSPRQAARANELARAGGLAGHCGFQVADALAMPFPDGSFDLVWACESGEHMPDKGRYVAEMARVLKPGGVLVIATWCQRETPPALTPAEVDELRFLYEEWSHPYFISNEEYGRLVAGTGQFAPADVVQQDWAAYTLPSWRHSVWVGVLDPLPVFRAPGVWLKTARDIYCLERMHRAFAKGLMTYGMTRAQKERAA